MGSAKRPSCGLKARVGTVQGRLAMEAEKPAANPA